jgi:hypothetical protein
MFMKKFTVLTGFLLTSLLMGSLSEASGRAWKKYERDEKAMRGGRKPRIIGQQPLDEQKQQIMQDAERAAVQLLENELQVLKQRLKAIEDSSGNENVSAENSQSEN